MTCVDSVVPRQRLWMGLMVTALLLLQVDGWSLPKSQTKLNLPFDFPVLQSFYRVVALPSATDDGDPRVEWSIRRQRVHLQDGEGESKPYKRSVIEVDTRNGSMWLVRRAEDLDVYVAATKAGKPPAVVFVTATVIASGSSKTAPHRTDLRLEFSRPKLSFCRPSPLACFPFPPAGKYLIPEGSATGREFDFLQNLRFNSLCPDTKVEYALTTDSGVVEINGTTGALTLSQSPDFEELPSFVFNATCSVGGETFTTVGEVAVGDTNDSPPTTQSGNSTATLIHHIRPGQRSLHFPVSAKDRDSKSENGLEVRIEGDVLRLFRVEDVKIYGGLASGRDTFTFLQAEIKSRGLLSFPNKEYNFSVIIEDVKLMQKERQVTYDIVLINDTETEIILKDVYEVNISRNAEQYARIIELSASSSGHTFHLSSGDNPYDFVAVTSNAGIVYLRDPSLIPGPSSVRRSILWKGPNGKSGTILLIISIQDDIAKSCDPSPKWCSSNADETRCLATCGKGSKTGVCSWRQGSLTSAGPRPDYATCSPDLNSCPDRQCDELEKLEHTLCPQDCAKEFSGEVVPSKSGRGLDAAVGPCHCPATDHCICIRNFPPAEMRRRKPQVSGSIPATASTLHPPIVIEIHNGSLADGEKMFQWNLDTTTPLQLDLVPVQVEGGGVCGVGCVAALTVLLACVLVVLLAALWRLRPFFSPHPKSGHVSLSGVPSDYVDEDSRNSETSSFGKASLAEGVKWEFPRSRLQLQCVLGEGEFGKVVKARAWNIGGVKGFTTVAVKMIKDNGGAQEKQDLMMEFMLLKEISHPNVIKLLGASTEKSGPFYLIVEFAEMGSLRCYLRRRRRHNCCDAPYPTPADECSKDYYRTPCTRYEPNHVYFHKEQLSFTWQIAKGMAYLSDMKLVHRDLAARNVLLAKHKVVKISDFGLSRDIYEGDAYLKKSKGRVPVKWMAIESLEDQIYTSRSDVWSFGVVLWEIMMQGATPYPGVTPQRLYNLLKAGYRMSKPENCSDEMYYLMRQCWRMPPRERPSFKELVLKLEFLLQDTVEYMDLVSKERYQRMHSSIEITTPKDPAPTIQYTSVLVENDDEEEDCNSDQECGSENIGLVRLFGTPQDNSSSLTTRLVSTTREESTA